MNPELPPSPSTPTRQSFPSWKQGLVLCGGSLVLAVSACFGCLFTLNNEAIALFFASLAGLGAIGVLIGAIFIFIRIVRTLVGTSRQDTSAPTPPATSS
jgi:hypothetical protein